MWLSRNDSARPYAYQLVSQYQTTLHSVRSTIILSAYTIRIMYSNFKLVRSVVVRMRSVCRIGDGTAAWNASYSLNHFVELRNTRIANILLCSVCHTLK
jgi:hypothetical protein